MSYSWRAVGVYSRIVESRFAKEPAVDPGRPAPGDLGEVVDDVGERIQEIVDAAERVGALTESLGFRIESLQRDAQALVDVLDRARASLTGLAELSVAPAGSEAEDPAPEVEPPSRPQPARPRPVPDVRPAPKPDQVPEQAVLRATQMAVAGTERTEIEKMLRTEFDVSDPARVVEQLLRAERR